MFLGHLAFAFAGKRLAPEVPLGLAFVASEWPDAVWPVLLLAGVERASVAPGDTRVTPLRFDSYPLSHSLLMVAVWALLLALAWRARGGSRRGAGLLGALAVSHWLLDAVSHRPDLPLTPWGTARVGLGLWNSLPGTLAVELTLFAVGLWLYARPSWPRAGASRLAIGVLGLGLPLIHLGNLFGPPPPGITAVGLAALLAVPLLWLWGNGVDRRVTRA